MKEKEFDKLLRESLQKSGQHIALSDKARQKILQQIHKRPQNSWLHRFLEYEICIPITPLCTVAAGCLIAILYLSIFSFKISPQEVSNSEIHLVKLD